MNILSFLLLAVCFHNVHGSMSDAFSKMCPDSVSPNVTSSLISFAKECTYNTGSMMEVFRSCNQLSVSECDSYFVCETDNDRCVVNREVLYVIVLDRLNSVDNVMQRLISYFMEWIFYVLLILFVVLYEHRHDTDSLINWSLGTFVIIVVVKTMVISIII